MKIAFNPGTGLYFDGNAFTLRDSRLAKPIAISDGLFRVMFTHPVEIIDTEAPQPAVTVTERDGSNYTVPVKVEPAKGGGLTVTPATVPAHRPPPLVLTNKKGITLRSAFTRDIDAHQALVARINKGGASDFELSMEAAYHAHVEHGKHYTVEQRYWLHKLASDSVKPKPEVKTETINLEGLRTMFANAAKTLKRPAIVLGLKDRSEVKIALAGAQSKYTGQLMVSGPKFGGAYYGRVDGATFVPGRNDTPEVRDLLRKLSVDPQKTAAEHGHLTGKCCFCNRKLDDERSTEVGYGPVCAEKFGLNWGSKIRQTA